MAALSESRFTLGMRLLLAMISTLVCASAQAGAIPFNTFLQFGFAQIGIPATGCDPADPSGPVCIPSGGTPTSFLDAPPWTLNTLGAATLIVTDVFESGDQFELFDFGVSLGLTSPPGAATDCGDDPALCLANAQISHGSFSLAAGAHSLTLTPTLAPSNSGTGYLMVIAEAEAAVSEPASLSLLMLAGLATFVSRRFARSAR